MMRRKAAMQRAVALLLVLTMLFSLCPAAFAEMGAGVEPAQTAPAEQPEDDGLEISPGEDAEAPSSPTTPELSVESEASTEASTETTTETTTEDATEGPTGDGAGESTEAPTEETTGADEEEKPDGAEEAGDATEGTTGDDTQSADENGADANETNGTNETNAPAGSETTEQESVLVSSLQLVNPATSDSNATVASTAQQAFQIVTNVTGPEQSSVWLGYRFSIPEKSESGGTYSFVSGSYSWLQALDSDTVPKVQTKDGQLIIEGKVENKTADGTVVPGLFTNSISIAHSNLVNNETATLTGESWVIGAEETSKQTATATITAQTESKYYIQDQSNVYVAISGYYNQTTGDFSLTKPADATGYVYGRVCRFVLYAWPQKGTERLDPTKPISFDFSYDLIKRQGSQAESETDPAYQPLLLAVKQCNINVKESQLAGTPPIKDYTLGGLLPDNSNNNGPSNTPYYHGGDYTFTRDAQDTNKIHVSAVLSENNKKSNYQYAAIQGLVFVPLNEDDPSSLQRILKINAGNLEGTAYSGLEIQDTVMK